MDRGREALGRPLRPNPRTSSAIASIFLELFDKPLHAAFVPAKRRLHSVPQAAPSKTMFRAEYLLAARRREPAGGGSRRRHPVALPVSPASGATREAPHQQVSRRWPRPPPEPSATFPPG